MRSKTRQPSAVQADAASHIDFKGFYRAYYYNAYNVGGAAEKQAFTDSYFGHRLNIDMTFRPTDEIAVHWRMRSPHFQRWGSSGNMSMETRHVYGEIKQDWGTVLVGRMNEDLDNFGLASLGYMPGSAMFTGMSPFDGGSPVDGIRWTNRWDNGFQLTAQYAKKAINTNTNSFDGYDANGDPTYSGHSSDADYDRYQVEGAYFWDGGGASLGVIYDRDATANGGDTFAVWDSDGFESTAWGRGYGDANVTTAWYVNPAIAHSWGDFSMHFEGMAGWGKTKYNNGWDVRRGRDKVKDQDAEGYAFYLDADYNYGPGNVMLAGWYSSGNDADDSDKNKALVAVDQGNFYPLLVAYNYTSLGGAPRSSYGAAMNMVTAANSKSLRLDQGAGFVTKDFDYGDSGAFLNNSVLLAGTGFEEFGVQVVADGKQRFANGNGDANVWGINLAGNHAFTDDITMNYSLGYLSLVNPNYKVVNKADFAVGGGGAVNYGAFGYTEQDKDLGFEIDLGFTFQLLDNLTFNTTFGYMFTGDAYKTLKGYKVTENTTNNTGQVKAVWEDAKDTYIWANTLQFDF